MISSIIRIFIKVFCAFTVLPLVPKLSCGRQFSVLLSVKEMNSHLLSFSFLADRTNGRAIATLLRLSSSSSVTLCIVAKRCVLEQKLLWRAYRKSYMRNRLVPK